MLFVFDGVDVQFQIKIFFYYYRRWNTFKIYITKKNSVKCCGTVTFHKPVTAKRMSVSYNAIYFIVNLVNRVES